MENKLVKSVISASKYVFNRKLVSGLAGNISGRFHDGEGDIIAITPTLVPLTSINDKNIVLVNIDGEVLSKGKPSSEVNMHIEIYKKNKNVNGIVHTHSPYATGFAFSDKKIKRLEGFGAIKDEYLPEVEYFKPGSMDLAINCSEKLINEDVAILKNHGVVATGINPQEAAFLAEFIEESAKTQFITSQLMKK